MGLHETAEHGESSSGRNPLPTLDLSAAKLYMTHFQIEKNIQDDLSKDFSQSQQNLLAFFHTLYLNTTIFKSDAIAISRIMINLLEFYLKCTLPNGCPWEFKTAIPIELKGETLWRTIREMIKNGFLRKGMMGYFSETYSVLEYSNNNFSSTEAMVVPSGVEIRSDNHSRIDIKPRLMSACRRYLQQQEFVGNVSKLLIDCFAHLERFTLNGDEEQKSLVRLLDQILKRNDWALANQVLRLVTDLKELYVITCLSTMGVATFEEMLGKARKVSSESEEVICSYKELLETFAKKLASHDKGLGIPGNYFAVAGLPTRYEEQASYFILCDPAIFISQENGLNIRWPSVELKKQATDMSDRIPTQPDQALIAMRYNREYFSREFASLGASKKSALLKPHQKPAFSLLYCLLTGDFKQDFPQRPFDIHLINRLWEWQELRWEVTDLNWAYEFDQSQASGAPLVSAIHGLRLLTLAGIYHPVLKILQKLNQEQQRMIFYAIMESLHRSLCTYYAKHSAKQLIAFLIQLDPHQSLALLKELQMNRTIYLVDHSQAEIVLQLNSFYHTNKIKSKSWDSLMEQLRGSLYNLGENELLRIIAAYRYDLELLYISEINQLVEKNFFMNNHMERLDQRWWFVLLILSETQIMKFSQRPGLALSLITKYFLEILFGNNELEPFVEIVQSFCRHTTHEFDFCLSNIEQESNRQLYELLQKGSKGLLLDWVRLSTTISLASSLEGLLRAKYDIVSNPAIDQEVIKALIKKVSTFPTHPCIQLLNQNTALMSVSYPLLASAPPVYEAYTPVVHPFEQEAIALKRKLESLEAEHHDLKLRHEVLLAQQAQSPRQTHTLTEEKVQDLLEAQTKLLLESLRSEPEKLQALEIEIKQLKHSLTLKEKLIFSNKFPWNSVKQDAPVTVRPRRHSFS